MKRIPTSAGLEISHPDKVLFPDDGITKRELVEYYRRMAPRMMPYLRGRPISMERFPDGISGEGFYQKRIPDYFPDFIERAWIPTRGGRQQQAVCANADTLIYLANQACITPHAWLSRIDRLDFPDQMIFDLDPAHEDVSVLRAAAIALKDLLEELGLHAVPKTTGSRGVHIRICLDQQNNFDVVRAFARDAARLLASRHSDELTVEQRIAKRRGRLYLDVARNAYGQTAVPPFAVRARPSAPVAVPITWDELQERNFSPRQWTLRDVARLEKRKNAWPSHLPVHSLTRARERLDRLVATERSG